MSDAANTQTSATPNQPRGDSYFSRIATQMIGVDLRALAAWRICLATIVIIDLALRSRWLTAHYSDFGVLPRWALLERFTDPWQWSIHTLSGKALIMGALMLVHAVFAMAMLVGFRTRLAVFLTWAMTISLQNRNPMILDGGDVMLRILLFWAMFLPLGARASIDRITASRIDEDRTMFWSFATIGLIVQICLIYWYNAWHKIDVTWMTDRTAVYYALSIDAFATPAGQWLREFPNLMRWLTASTLWWEFWGPFLLFIPLVTRYTRAIAVLAFMGLHLGFAITLALGIFPVIGMIAWIPFIPSPFWNWLVRRRVCVRASTVGFAFAPWLRDRCKARPLRVPQSRLAAAACIGLTVYVVLWNVRGFNDANTAYYNRVLTYRASIPALLLRLDQKWAMFSPYPLKDDGWYVIPAVLTDGSIVDLWTHGEPVTWSKPDDVAAHYRDQRWRKYLLNIWQRGYADHRSWFAKYLARDWNQSHGENKQILRLVMYYMREDTLPDYKTEPVKRVRLWWYYVGELPANPEIDVAPPGAGEFTPAAD